MPWYRGQSGDLAGMSLMFSVVGKAVTAVPVISRRIIIIMSHVASVHLMYHVTFMYTYMHV